MKTKDTTSKPAYVENIIVRIKTKEITDKILEFETIHVVIHNHAIIVQNSLI